MEGSRRPIRSVRCACIAASLALLPSAHAAAGEAAEISPGKWVRIMTGSDVAAEGVVMGSREARASAVSNDKQTATFEVNGRPVRVAKPRTAIEGTVQSLDQKTLMLGRPGQSPILVPRDAISSVDVRRRESKKGLGVVIGLIAGGGIGYAIGAATSGPGCQGGETGFAHLCSLDELGKPAGAILGVVGGAVLGLIVAPGAKWEKNVPLDHIHVGLGPTRNRGIGLSLSVAF